MTVLEDAVANLADALEVLEGKLEAKRFHDASGDDDLDAARRQARTARGHTNEASRALAKSIDDLRAILAQDDSQSPGKGAKH